MNKNKGYSTKIECLEVRNAEGVITTKFHTGALGDIYIKKKASDLTPMEGFFEPGYVYSFQIEKLQTQTIFHKIAKGERVSLKGVDLSAEDLQWIKEILEDRKKEDDKFFEYCEKVKNKEENIVYIHQ